MPGWARRLIVAAVLAAALYFASGALATALLLNHLTMPGTVDWAGANNPSPPSDPVELGYRGDPQAAFGLTFETIRYDTPLGPAEAWLIPGTASSGPWAIYVHGIGGIRENGYRQLIALREAGFTTLMLTYRNDAGAPAAPNPLYAFGTTEWHDLDAAVTWALANGAPSVVIVAESMGGGIAGQFLRHSAQVDRVAALALDAPALDFHHVVTGALNRLHLPFASEVATAGIRLFDLTRNATLGSAYVLDDVAAFPRPLFLAHGSADTLVPVAISDTLVPRRTAPTTYLRTEAEHLLSYKENPTRYREEMVGFLKALLP